MKTFFGALAASLSLLTAGILLYPADHEKNETESKEAPYEWMMLHRSWPDATFDVDAYKQAIETATGRGAMYKTIPAGFSRAWTLQGPTNIGGRFNTIAIDPSDTNIIYAGSADGGIFKTIDGGRKWSPVFDQFSYLGISHLLIDPKNHNIIYAGTGDPNISGDPVIGDGIYRSTDAGKSWTHLGPSEGKIVARILLHPDSSNVIYAACMGNPFARDPNRGLYKSADSGKTWKKLLFVDNQTGIIDIIMDPKDPKTMYASAWTRIRTNRETTVFSKEDHIYKTTDGGQTWKKLGKGLPSYPVSRIGIAVSSKNPKDLYAIIVDTLLDLEGVYKSVDAGNNWYKMSKDGLPNPVMGNFGWYFGKVYINPANDSDIYFGSVELYRYSDTFGNWRQETPFWGGYSVHADKHDLQWLSGSRFLLATDGGLYRHDVATGIWEDADEIPNTQFYHVAFNPFQPGTFFGGAQDNGTTGGNKDDMAGWSRIWGGDGFRPAFDPTDSNTMYAETQNGNVVELSTTFGFRSLFSPKATDKCSWDMPYMLDRFNSSIIYTGTDKIYSNASGINKYDFQPISQDLTDGNIYGSQFHNITTMDQSPLDEKYLFAGTADGNVWKTTDGGNNWDSITHTLPDRYVTSVKASAVDKQTIYVTHSGYKYNETIPHIHKSTDLGKTWKDISGDLPPLAVNDLWIYPKNDSFLFVATDAGVYGSVNGGLNWMRIGTNMPIYPIIDIEFNPVSGQLIAATFARSIMTYPMDSILRDFTYTAIKSNNAEDKVVLFPNPVREQLNLTLPQSAGTTGLNNVTLTIFNLEGRLIVKQEVMSSPQITLPATGLKPGSYILHIQSGSTSKTIKFLKI